MATTRSNISIKGLVRALDDSSDALELLLEDNSWSPPDRDGLPLQTAKLQNIGVAIKIGPDTWRAASFAKQFFSRLSGREAGLFDLDEDHHAIMEKFDKLVDSYAGSVSDGRDGRDELDVIEETLYDISDRIESSIVDFDGFITGSFANFKTLRHKLSQNAHAVARADKLCIWLDALAHWHLLDKVAENPLCSDIEKLLRAGLLSDQKLPRWRAKAMQQLRQLGDTLSKLRQQTRRVADFSLCSRKLRSSVSEHDSAAPLSITAMASWCQPAPIVARPKFDPAQESQRSAFHKLASSCGPRERPEFAPKPPSSPSCIDIAPESESEINPTEHHALLADLAASSSATTALSASEWLLERHALGQGQGIPPHAWIAWLACSMEPAEMGLAIEPLHGHSDGFLNAPIIDILVRSETA